MKNIIFLIALLVLVFSYVQATNTDPCVSYQAIDEWKRSLRNNDVQPPLCDTFLASGWYRSTSKAGGDMPTSCPKRGFRCGTLQPIWLNGSLPSPGQTVNVTACASHYDGTCCKKAYPIQVKNCNGFYVYNLVKTSTCPEAYCFGKEMPCPTGYTSPNGYSPGCKYEPCLPINHEPLDNWKRSSGNNNSDNVICDSFLAEKWYKPISKAGKLMPSTCPKGGFRCSTLKPIWLNGSHPTTVNVTVNATACVSDRRKGCCSQQYNIQIRNCGKFNIYNLEPTNQCPQAYCFGSEIPCPVGETSDNGFSPGCEFDPCYHANYEVLSGQSKRSSNYTLKPDDTLIDDSSMVTGWYRIKSDTGNDIVTTQQPEKQCGTNLPIWMQGTIPSEAEKTQTRKVCLSEGTDVCKMSWNIKIRNCGQFRTYYLPKVSKKNAGYCFGTKVLVENSGGGGKDSPTKTGTIVWISVVSVLVGIIMCLVALYITKHVKQKAVEDIPPPPYSPTTNGIEKTNPYVAENDVRNIKKMNHKNSSVNYSKNRCCKQNVID